MHSSFACLHSEIQLCVKFIVITLDAPLLRQVTPLNSMSLYSFNLNEICNYVKCSTLMQVCAVKCNYAQKLSQLLDIHKINYK